MFRLLSIVVASFVLVFFIGLNISFAQEIRGTISGTVVIENPSVLGTQVTLVNKSISRASRYEVFNRITITDESGKFTFSHVPYGVYDIKIKKDCVTFRKTDVEIKSAETVNVEIKIASENCQQKELEENAKWKVCEEKTSDNLNLTDSDKLEIYREILRDSEDQPLSDFPVECNFLENQTKECVMFSESQNEQWLKQIPNFNVSILSSLEIQKMAKKRKKDIWFVSLNYKAANSCVKANVYTSFSVGKKQKGAVYLGGGGCSYIFRKESGKWIGKQEICQVS